MGIEWLDVPEGSLRKGWPGHAGWTGVCAEGLILGSSGGSEIDGLRVKGPELLVWIHVCL